MDNALVFARSSEHTAETRFWQPLRDHLLNVADKAAQFARAFESEDWGRLAGLWHDLGKFQNDFQRKLLGNKIRIEHSGVGAAHCWLRDPEKSITPMAFAIAGHHGGLPDFMSSAHGHASLVQRIRNNEAALKSVFDTIPEDIRNYALPALPAHLLPSISDKTNPDSKRRSLEFWTRFIFSALVDSDRLDAESFCAPDKASRRGKFESITDLRVRLDQHLAQLVASIPADLKKSTVNNIRGDVLDACINASSRKPGFFALTVPTGGGKTLSSLAFALNHAEKHGLRRIITVIPYTSIIEQNAAVYSTALGRDNVIEHHSNYSPDTINESPDDELSSYELATENWDAPIIVTTTVQFFETLFSNRPSTCRKLHNMAKSVILLDEVQTLPVGLLAPILDALNELVANYGCSVVLSTATPPALSRRTALPSGLDGVTPIINSSEELYSRLKRIAYHWPASDTEPLSWRELALKVIKHPSVMVIVHLRRDARELAQELAAADSGAELFHLSALMCPAHRSAVIAVIRSRLSESRPCRVVSTQLVEAGVDLDFPVVFRAMGGLDSIVQAAGRCNREGKLDIGHVHIFRAPTQPPAGTPRKALETMSSLLVKHGSNIDPEQPDLCDSYFRMLYMTAALDQHEIQMHRALFNFATVGDSFRMIEDGHQRSIIVPYGQAPQLVSELRLNGPDRALFRKLQQYAVNIPHKSFQDLFDCGAVEELHGISILASGYESIYDNVYGLLADKDATANPESFVI